MYPQTPPPPPLAARLPRLHREQFEAANIHLRTEAELIMAFIPFVELLCAYERETTWTHDEMTEFVALWDKGKTAAQQLAESHPQRRKSPRQRQPR